jgi:hypothetical protein
VWWVQIWGEQWRVNMKIENEGRDDRSDASYDINTYR